MITSELKKKIQAIIRRYIQSGNADKLRTEGMQEIQRLVRQYGVVKLTATELKPMLKETTDELQTIFLQKRVGELPNSTQRAIDAITLSANSESKKIDQKIINGVRRGLDEALKGNLNWRDVARVSLRQFDLAENHIETNITTVQAALNNATRFEQFKSAGVKYLKYVGPSGTVRNFCKEHIGGVYTIDEVLNMLNDFKQRAMFYCGGWNCRHRWAVATEEEYLAYRKAA